MKIENNLLESKTFQAKTDLVYKPIGICFLKMVYGLDFHANVFSIKEHDLRPPHYFVQGSRCAYLCPHEKRLYSIPRNHPMHSFLHKDECFIFVAYGDHSPETAASLVNLITTLSLEYDLPFFAIGNPDEIKFERAVLDEIRWYVDKNKGKVYANSMVVIQDDTYNKVIFRRGFPIDIDLEQQCGDWYALANTNYRIHKSMVSYLPHTNRCKPRIPCEPFSVSVG